MIHTVFDLTRASRFNDNATLTGNTPNPEVANCGEVISPASTLRGIHFSVEISQFHPLNVQDTSTGRENFARGSPSMKAVGRMTSSAALHCV
jgi:hypothetical protein